jgi:hypothetical protein
MTSGIYIIVILNTSTYMALSSVEVLSLCYGVYTHNFVQFNYYRTQRGHVHKRGIAFRLSTYSDAETLSTYFTQFL